MCPACCRRQAGDGAKGSLRMATLDILPGRGSSYLFVLPALKNPERIRRPSSMLGCERRKDRGKSRHVGEPRGQDSLAPPRQPGQIPRPVQLKAANASRPHKRARPRRPLFRATTVFQLAIAAIRRPAISGRHPARLPEVQLAQLIIAGTAIPERKAAPSVARFARRVDLFAFDARSRSQRWR